MGSFLSVCIYRLPEKRSILVPASSCGNCGKKIAFYHNIPIASYMLLGGKCYFCKAKIGIETIIVELIGAIFALACFGKFGFSFEALTSFIFISLLILITFIDIRHMIIPDIVTIPFTLFFFCSSFFSTLISYMDSLIGIIAGAGSLFFIASIYKLFTKKEGMGRGDIKLLAMIGSAIGVKGVIFTLMTASISGSIGGLIYLALSKNRKTDYGKSPIPFGPFLAVGAVCHIFFGEPIIKWYFSFVFR